MAPLPDRPLVAVVFRYVHHYRRPFYELLRTELDRRGIELVLVYGQPGPHEVAKDDAVEVAWGTRIVNRYLVIGSKDVCWQPCLGIVRDADLVIVEQASRLLATYALLVWRKFGGPKVAFWGHGRNIRPHAASHVGECVKAAMTRRADWFFAYNELSVKTLRAQGYQEARTSVVQNAVDTAALRAQRDDVDPSELADLRERFGLRGDNVGVFVGALYPEKRLPFLVAAADIVRRDVPDFELLVLGAGPDEQPLRQVAASRPWVRVVGALYGEEKAKVMLLGKALLLPGLVGLAILDGFALGLPIMTTRVPFHSDEIAYLEDGVNGVIVEEWRDPAPYAAAVTSLLGDPARLERMRTACGETAAKYTVRAMAENFADGVVRALEVTGAR